MFNPPGRRPSLLSGTPAPEVTPDTREGTTEPSSPQGEAAKEDPIHAEREAEEGLAAPTAPPSPEEVEAVIAAARARNEADLLRDVARFDVLALRELVGAHFPEYWTALEAALAVEATLLLADNANPTVLILVGAPGSGKTTVADMFEAAPMVYHSDNFTPAAFVSHATNVKREKLAAVDLLPRIQYKLLVTPELAPIFRGKEDDLVDRFKVITRVLDGRGLVTDSGTHGKRGYKGDYLFSWLGCTTPFNSTAWKVMAQLGSRLFFFQMGAGADCTVEDLVRASEGLPYRERLVRCREVVGTFLTALLRSRGGLPEGKSLGAIRSVSWDREKDPLPVKERIGNFALLLARMRGMREEGTGSENPRRAYAVLSNIARGRSLLYGRAHLTEADLPLVARIAVDSVPHSSVVRALGLEGRLTVAQVQGIIGAGSHHTAERIMRDLTATKVVVEEGAPKVIRLAEGWEWLVGSF